MRPKAQHKLFRAYLCSFGLTKTLNLVVLLHHLGAVVFQDEELLLRHHVLFLLVQVELSYVIPVDENYELVSVSYLCQEQNRYTKNEEEENLATSLRLSVSLGEPGYFRAEMILSPQKLHFLVKGSQVSEG